MDLLIFLIVFVFVNCCLIRYAKEQLKEVSYVDRTRTYTYVSDSDLEEMRRMVNSNNSRF